MMYLLDTNVLSENMKPSPDARVQAFLASGLVTESFISVLTLAELEQGILRLGETRRAAEFTAYLRRVEANYHGRILVADLPVARTWARITAEAFRRGQPLGYTDAWLAATAATHNLVVVTRNVADFQAAGVGLLNPWEHDV